VLGNSRVRINAGTNPFVGTMLPWATVTGPAGYDLATDFDGDSATAPYFVGRVQTYVTDINLATATTPVRLNGGTHTLTADRTVAGLLLENGATVTGPFMLTIGSATAGFVAVRNGANTISTSGSGTNPGVQFGGREPVFVVENGATLTVSSTMNSTAALRKEGGGSLILSGDNDVAAGRQLTGATTVNAGTLVVRHANALGTEPGGTVQVNRRAVLVLDTTDGALNIGNKPMNIGGLGLNDDGTGALRVIGGNTATLGAGATAYNWRINPTIVFVDAGTILDINGNVANTNNNPVFKRGAGELIYSSATTGNTNTAAVTVNEGTLTLNKVVGNAVGGALTLNDLGNYDGVGAAIVRYGAAATGNQIADGVSVVVNANSTLNLNGVSDTISALTVQGGSVLTGVGVLTENGALVMSGGSITGNLVLNNNLTYNSGLTLGGAPTISGNLNLGGATRTFTINDGHFVHNDLAIDALINNGRIVKAGAGALLLSNAGNAFLPGINEVQRIVVTGATAGTSQFNINFNGNLTGSITVNATDATSAGLIDAALEALPNVGVGGVNVTTTGAGQFDIEFIGHLAQQDVPNQITVNVVTAPGTYTPSTPTGGVAGINHTAGILAFDNNSALGSARVQLGNAQLLPIGDRTITNNLTFNNNVTTTLGGRRDFGGTGDLVVNGGVTLHSSVGTGQVVNLDVNDTQISVTFASVVSGGGNFIVPNKRGVGLLTLAGNNTFDTRDFVAASAVTIADGVRVDGGILRLTHPNALGLPSAPASLTVRGDAGAVLELDGTTANGPVNLTNFVPELIGVDNGFARGYLNRSSTIDFYTGILRNLGGSNSITSPAAAGNQIRLRHAPNNNANLTTLFVGIDAGSLNLNGALTGLQNDAVPTAANNKSVIKTGGGTLRYSGGTGNTITGTTAVFDGVLELNKTAGQAIANGGALQSGDNVGGNNSAEVRYIPGSAADQIGSGAVTINADGLLNLNGYGLTDTFNGLLTLITGATMSGDVATGAGTNFDPLGNVTVSVRPGVNTAVPATITGGVSMAATRTFTVNGSPADVQLSIPAVISGAGGLTKSSNGRLVLSGANTYAGAVTINSPGALRVQHVDALGDSGAATATTVNGGGALELNVTGTIDNENITASGSGIVNGLSTHVWNNANQNGLGSGAIRNLGGAAVVAGTVTLGVNPTLIQVGGGSLNFAGVLAYGGNGLVKSGAGLLELSGAASNTGTGSTSVQEGELRLNKSGAAIAIPGGTLFVGDHLGADNGDVVRYAATAGTDQIGNIPVRIASTGLLDLNGISDSITPPDNTQFVLDVGPLFSANVTTGAGTLTLPNGTNKNLTVVANSGTSALSVAAEVAGFLSFSAVTRQIDVRESSAPVELTISAVIANGAGGFNKAGRGTLAISGDNTYTGATTVNADSGTLLANTPSTVAASAYTVNAGSVLGGTGFITGAVTAANHGSNLLTGGTINPGPATGFPVNTGILTVNNNVTFGTRAVLYADINGTTAGTQHDLLRVGGTGTVTINTTAVNGSVVGGRTGIALPLNSGVKLIDKTSAGAITGNFINAVPPSPPAMVQIGVRNYNFNYADNSGGVLGDGNDFVLVAQASTVTWDGRQDGSLANTGSNLWTTPNNWVGDLAPAAGDTLLFDNLGVNNGSVTPTNDFLAGTSFPAILLANSLGSYTLSGNQVLLNGTLGGVTQDNAANLAVTNNVNLPLATATNPQAITVTDGGLLNLGGAITLGSGLTLADGAGVGDVNVTGTINGGSILSIDLAGDATFSAPLGGVTPLAAISVASVDDLAFNNTIATSGNVTQTTGTGTTTFSGGTINGTLTATNEVIVLTGGTNTVTGTVTLTATVGGILDGNGAANNITTTNVSLTAVTGVGAAADPIETTLTNFEASTATGGIFLSNSGVLNIGNVSAVLSGVDVTGGSGAISLAATGSINIVTMNEDISGPGNITLDAQGAASDLITSGNHAPSAIRSSGAAAQISLTAGRDVLLGTAAGSGHVTSAGSSIVSAGRDVVLRQGTQLDVNGAGTNVVIAGRDLVLFNDGLASRITTRSGLIDLTANRDVIATTMSGTNSIDSTQSGMTPAGTNITITATTGTITLGDGVNAGTAGNVTLNALTGSINDTNLNGATRVLGNGLTAAAAAGIVLESAVNTVTSATVSGPGAIDLRELDALTLAIVTTANGNATITAGGALSNSVGANISVIGLGSFGGSTITLGNQAGDMVNLSSLAFNSAGAVNIAEDSSTQLAGTSAAGSLVLSSVAGLTNTGTAILTVTGNATLTATSISLGDQAGDAINFGSLTFTATAGGTTVEENSSLNLLGANMASGPIALTSVDGVGVGQDLVVPGGASVTSTGNSVTLTAGDFLTVAVGGVVQAATTVTLNADTLADADVGTGATVSLAGAVTATAGDLTLNTGADGDSVTVSGVLTAGSAGAGNGNIAINLGAGSDVLTADGAAAGTFNAIGDQLLIAGGAGSDIFGLGSATNAAIINAVTTTVQGFDFGGTEGVGVDGGDAFNVRFSTTTNFVLEGDDPTMAPGDVVNIDFTGAVGIATEFHGDPDTTVSVAGFNPITYREMEGSNSLGGLVNHVFDLNVFASGTVFDVQLLDSNTMQVALDGMVFFTGLDDGVNSLTFAGRAGTDDVVRIHGSAGGLLLSEAGGLPGMGAMPLVDGVRKSVSGSFTAAQRSLPNMTNPPAIYFDGRGGSDAIVLDLTSARDAAYFSDNSFPGSGDLSVQATGGPVNGLAATFRNLESVHILNRSGAGGSLLVDASSTPLTTSLTVTNIADPVAPLYDAVSPVNNTPLQGGVANLVFAGASRLTSDAGVLPTTFGGFNSVTVRGGNGGIGENMTIASVDGGASIGGGTLANLILDGGSTRNLMDVEVTPDLNIDTLQVQSLPANVTATLLGRGGNDIYSLFDAGNTVENITGQVIVDGGLGANDQLVIVDSGDMTGDTVLIDTVGQAAPNYRIEGITGATGAGVNDIIYRNIDTLTLTGTSGDDLLDAKFLTQAAYAHDLKVLTLNGWTGADRFLLDLPDNAPGSLTSGLTSVNLNGDAAGNPNANNPTELADTFGQSPAGIIGTGAGQQGLAAPARPLRPSLNTAIVINGGRPSVMGPPAGDVAGDVLNLDLSLIPTAATRARNEPGLIVSTTPGQVLAFDTSGTPQPYGAFNFTEIEDLNLYENNVLTNVQIGDLFVRATNGDDTIQFSKAGSSSNPGLTRMRLNNLVLDFTLTGGKVVVFARDGRDNISQQNVEGPAEFFGEDGNDYISGGTGNDLLVGGLGNDQINGSEGNNVIWGDNMPTTLDPNPQDSQVGGNDKLSGLVGQAMSSMAAAATIACPLALATIMPMGVPALTR
jgi:fibronectin-binding autotransporter adhesin